MTLVRFNPMRELMEVEREFSRLFNNYENRFGFAGENDSNEDYNQAVWSPLTDIYEDNEMFQLKMDLPGISKEDVNISYSDGKLSVSGERRQVSETEHYKYHRVERSFGRFYRSFNLPKDIENDKISAEFKNGQLEIGIPKSEKAKPKSIEVKVK